MMPFRAMRMRNSGAGGGGPYSEIGYLGQKTGAGTYNMSGDEKGGIPIVVPGGGIWVKTCQFEIKTASTGNKIKPILMSGTGTSGDTLFATGQEFVHPSNISVVTEISINWNADGSALFVPAGNYLLGYHTSASQIAQSLSAGNTYWKADTYADGTASTFGGAPSVSGSSTLNVWTAYSVTGP